MRALPLPGSPSTDAQTWRQASPRSERFLQLQRRTHTRTDHSSLSLQCAISTTKNQHAFAISETTGLGIKPPTRIISKTHADSYSSVARMNRVFVTLFETGAWTTNLESSSRLGPHELEFSHRVWAHMMGSSRRLETRQIGGGFCRSLNFLSTAEPLPLRESRRSTTIALLSRSSQLPISL